MLSLLGSASKPKFKYHAAETNGVLHFAVVLARRFALKLGASFRFWLQALTSMERIVELIPEYNTVFPVDKQQEFCEQVCLHISACKRMQPPLKPKHHMLIELAGRCPTMLGCVFVRC